MKRIDIGSIELNVVDRGSGRPLLLVHGYPLDHTMWQAQIDGLADRARAIAPDLRGFGHSDVTAGTTSMAQLADDLAALLDAMQVAEPVTFCGLSMGGYVGWQFFLRHRQRLGALIACDTRAVADDEVTARARHLVAETVLAEGAAAAVEPMVERLFAPRTLADQPALVEATRAGMLHAPPPGIAAVQRGMAERIDATELLFTIDVPALVVCGAADAISPPEEMRRIAESIPAATYREIPDAGHLSPLENPVAFNAAVVEFLVRLDN